MIPAEDKFINVIYKNSSSSGIIYIIKNLDWSTSSYRAQVRNTAGEKFFDFSVSASYDGTDTIIALTAMQENYENITEGVYPFDLLRDGSVLIYGSVHIRDGVTR